MAFARWDPLQDFLTLHERLNRLTGSDGPGWVPPVDLYETPDGYTITAEVPGLARDQLNISVQDGKLTLRGHREARDCACEQYHRVERGHGTFARSFALGSPVDHEAIRADLKNGLLTVQVPKKSPRRIAVE